MTDIILATEPEKYSSYALRLYRSAGGLHLLPPGADRATLLDALADVTVLVVRLAHYIDAEVLRHAPKLRVIVSPTTGVTHIDMAACTASNVEVLTLRGETEFLSGITATAELAWGLLLAVVRRIPSATASVVRGEWDRDAFRSHEVQGKTLGILGLGRLGRMVARYGQAFRMRTLAYDPYQTQWEEGVLRCASLDELLSCSDVLSVHVPLNDNTRGMLGRRELALLPDGAVLINTARGEIMDEVALRDALLSGRLAGAGLDVLADELTGLGRSGIVRLAAELPQVVITPHMGGCTFESMARTEIFMAEKFLRTIKREAE